MVDLAARIEKLEGRLELLLGDRRAVGLLRAQGEDPTQDYDLANKKYVDGAATAVGVAVYNSSSIPVPSGVWIVLTFNSERRDDAAGFHSTVANTGRLTVPTGYAGWYVISGHAQFAGNATGSYREISVRLNGTAFIAINGTHPRTTVEIYESVAVVYYLSDADYVELVVLQDSGVSLNVAAAGNYSPEFRMVRI